jgi:hypothetical protein
MTTDILAQQTADKTYSLIWPIARKPTLITGPYPVEAVRRAIGRPEPKSVSHIGLGRRGGTAIRIVWADGTADQVEVFEWESDGEGSEG